MEQMIEMLKNVAADVKEIKDEQRKNSEDMAILKKELKELKEQQKEQMEQWKRNKVKTNGQFESLPLYLIFAYLNRPPLQPHNRNELCHSTLGPKNKGKEFGFRLFGLVRIELFNGNVATSLICKEKDRNTCENRCFYWI
ncbi:hypothetical protein QE152_g39092 [Popillia japonica]|uniref:Uncharacterized protein n=1 Tax=Popillia japonica TaxID=7064 RepID=A0AAW1HUK7_POPJA